MWKLLITWFSGGWTLGQSCTNLGTQRPLLWSASSFMFHILLLSPVVHSWQFASLSDCSIWGPPCRAWCRRSAPRWRPAARRTRRGWGCRTRWGPPGDLNNAASSAILQKVKGMGFWFLTNANWPKNVLHGFWYDNYCSVCMLVLTHGAVVTDPLVHGLGDPRLGLHQPGAAPHHRQQPRHLCSGVARLYCS